MALGAIKNEYSKPAENNAGFWRRFYIYQKERFPIIGHGLLVASFSFSAIAYARICRGADGFVSPGVFLVGIFTTITLFFLLRIFDEFKDAEEDAAYRRKLPVPRGLISFKELKIMGIVVAVAQVLVNALVFPKMLWLYFAIIGYLLLMGKEFFIGNWLKKHQFWYVVSHMLIVPLIDIYASGLDWLLAGVPAPHGLLFFFAVSFMSGIVLEIGRKIRSAEKEQIGVLTYSALLGAKRATLLWISMLGISLILSLLAARYAGYGVLATIVLLALFATSVLPALLFLKNASEKNARLINTFSGVWTMAMYLTLGGIPMLEKMLNNW